MSHTPHTSTPTSALTANLTSTERNRRTVAVILLVPMVVALALWAFAWPAARIAPRDLPVGIAGAAPAADQLQERMEQRAGAF